MFFDASLGMVEISPYSTRTRDKFGFDRHGNLNRTREPVPPRSLTQPQVEAAKASSAALHLEAGIKRATSGAIVGAQIWVLGAIAVLIAYLILFLFHRIRPYGSTVGRSARNLGQSALSAGQSAQSISRSLGETAALHIQVHKSELLARKAVAEAKLKRQDPDVDKHQVEIRANLRG